MIETPWVKLTQVSVEEKASLSLTWEDGSSKRLSLKKLIEEKEVFWRLRYPLYFKKVFIDSLGVLNWPEGEDLSPEYLQSITLGNEASNL